MSMLVLITSIAAVLAGVFTMVAGVIVLRASWRHGGDKAAQAEAARRSSWYPAMQLGLMLTMATLIAQNFAIAGQRGSMDLVHGFVVAVLGAGFGANLAALATTLAKRAQDRRQGPMG